MHASRAGSGVSWPLCHKWANGVDTLRGPGPSLDSLLKCLIP